MNLKKFAPWNWFKKENQSEIDTLPADVDHGYGFPFSHLHREMDKLYSNFFRGTGFPTLGFPDMEKTSGWVLKPHVNIAETEKEYNISIEIPGVEKDDVQLTVQDGTLIIKGEKRQEKDETDKNFHRIERSYGSFQRLISLPDDVDDTNVGAQFDKGVLTITLPRNASQKVESKRISIDEAA